MSDTRLWALSPAVWPPPERTGTGIRGWSEDIHRHPWRSGLGTGGWGGPWASGGNGVLRTWAVTLTHVEGHRAARRAAGSRLVSTHGRHGCCGHWGDSWTWARPGESWGDSEGLSCLPGPGTAPRALRTASTFVWGEEGLVWTIMRGLASDPFIPKGKDARLCPAALHTRGQEGPPVCLF